MAKAAAGFRAVSISLTSSSRGAVAA